MIEKIDKNQFIEIRNKEEQFSIITAFNDITFDSNSKTDDQVYSVQDYYTSDLPFGQKYFILSCLSLEEYYEVINYLVVNGYRRRLRFNIDNPAEYKGSRLKREVWNFERVQEEKDLLEKMVYIQEPYQYQLRIFVKVDRNKLNSFRELLKRLPGYKINWLLVDKEPFTRSDRIIK